MADTKAHTQTSGGHKGAFPPFQGETFVSQLVWLAIVFVALYVAMSRLALPRIGGIIEQRHKRISDDLADAQRLKDQSEAAGQAYEKTLAEARGNAQAIANKTRDALMAKAEERRKATEESLNRKLEEADKTIAATKSAAMTNVRAIAVDTASAIVQRLIGAAPADKAVQDAVADALKR